MDSLVGKVAVVTGASSGIGRGIATRAASQGAIVIAVGRSADRLRETCRSIESEGGLAFAKRCDVTSEHDVEALFYEVADQHGPVDILVNNAGVITTSTFEETTLADWNHVLAVNLTGVFLCMRAALRQMKERRTGRILNIGSISAAVPRQETAPYAASKAGLVGLTRAAAIEARASGIAIGCLHPGNVATEMRQTSDEAMNQEPMMSVGEIADLAIAMLAVGEATTVWEVTAFPVGQQFLGRG